MPAERFFIDAELSEEVLLGGPEYHHLTKVMRARVGDLIELINGKGLLAKAEVCALSKKEASLRILSHENKEEPPPLCLAVPLMRPSKLELVIEKCTELGASTFFLYPAELSEKKELSEHLLLRLKQITIASIKQCGRLYLPTLEVLSFSEIVKRPFLFADPRSSKKLQALKEPPLLITGPEAGFSKKELDILQEKGEGVLLHPNILRAETAPIVAACLLSIDQPFLRV